MHLCIVRAVVGMIEMPSYSMSWRILQTCLCNIKMTTTES